MMTSIDRQQTVAQIVAGHSECARVFQNHRIDFCCHGDVTVAEACAERGEDPEAVYAELENAVRVRDGKGPDDDVQAL